MRIIFLIFLSAFSISGFSIEKRQKIDVNVKEIKNKSKKIRKFSKNRQSNRAKIYRMKVKKILIKGINKTIRYLKKTVKKLPKKSSQRLDILEKLQALYREQALYLSDIEYRLYDKKWIRWDRSGQRGIEPEVDDSRSRKFWGKVVKLSSLMIKSYPKSKHADEFLYQKALAYSFLGKHDRAILIFKKLIRKFPNSSFVGDAEYSIGDYYFESGNFTKALKHYKKVRKFRNSKRYPWSLFKIGWCYYNMQKYRESILQWKKVVSFSKTSKLFFNLKNDALRDMAFSFVELNQVDLAIAYNKTHAGSEKIDIFLKKLGDIFSNYSKNRSAMRSYKEMLQIRPYSRLAPDVHKDFISLAYEDKKYSVVWNELRKLPKKYGKRSTWLKKNSKNKSLIKKTLKLIKNKILYYSKLFHSKGSKGKDKQFFRYALKGYDLFLKTYKKSKKAPEIKFLKADILYFDKRYKNAGGLYKEIVKLGKKKAVVFHQKKRYIENIHAKSAKYMLDSFLKAFQPEFVRLRKSKPNFKGFKRKISINSKNFIESCELYARFYKKDKKNTKNCDAIISEIYYRSNDKKRAVERLWVMIEKYPGSKEGFNSINSIIPIYKNNNKNLVKTILRVLKQDVYAKSPIGTKLAVLLNTVQVEQISKEKNFLKRAEMYRAHVQRNPHVNQADKLVFNSAVDFLSAKSMQNALDSFRKLINTYPKSPLVKSALIQLSQLYEKQLNFVHAANYYILLSKRFPKSKEAHVAIAKACDLYAAIRPKQAISICLKFAEFDLSGAKLIFKRLIDHEYFSENYELMTNLIMQIYIQKLRPTVAEQIELYGLIYQAYQGEGNLATSAARKIFALYRRSPSGLSGKALRVLGGMVFNQVNPVMNKLFQQKLVGGKINNLIVSIQRLAGFVGQVEQVFGNVLKTKDAYWGVAAYYQIARAYEYFANKLKTPPAIDGAKLIDVKKQLLPQIAQISKKSKDYFKVALNISRKFKIFSDWSAKVSAGLARMNGRKNMYFDDWIIKSDFIGSEIPGKAIRMLVSKEKT